MPIVDISIAKHEYENTETAVKDSFSVTGANTLSDLVVKSIKNIGSECGSDSSIYNVGNYLNVEAGAYIKLMKGVYAIVSELKLECPVNTFSIEVDSWMGPNSLTLQPVICNSTYPAS